MTSLLAVFQILECTDAYWVGVKDAALAFAAVFFVSLLLCWALAALLKRGKQ